MRIGPLGKRFLTGWGGLLPKERCALRLSLFHGQRSPSPTFPIGSIGNRGKVVIFISDEYESRKSSAFAMLPMLPMKRGQKFPLIMELREA